MIRKLTLATVTLVFCTFGAMASTGPVAVAPSANPVHKGQHQQSKKHSKKIIKKHQICEEMDDLVACYPAH